MTEYNGKKKREISIFKNSQRQWEVLICEHSIYNLALRKMHLKPARTCLETTLSHF